MSDTVFVATCTARAIQGIVQDVGGMMLVALLMFGGYKLIRAIGDSHV